MAGAKWVYLGSIDKKLGLPAQRSRALPQQPGMVSQSSPRKKEQAGSARHKVNRPDAPKLGLHLSGCVDSQVKMAS